MLLKSEITQTITSQQQQLLSQQTYPRKMLEKIKILPNFALVVSGIRRSGKSTLLTQLILPYSMKSLPKTHRFKRSILMKFK